MSITNQRELLFSHIKKHLSDVTVVAKKVVDGYSGATFQRPRFIEMMEEVGQGKSITMVCTDGQVAANSHGIPYPNGFDSDCS